jgi:TonB-linked SusC/RagA family outer membrane protein
VVSKIAEQQQQTEVSGTVTDAQTGEPLPGVNIVIQGTTQGTTTDMDGEYTIKAPPDATLVFSFVGYQETTVSVDEREEINVVMQQAVTELEEVVAIGYGTQQAGEVTSSAASVTSEDFAEGAVADAAELITGEVAGLSVVKPSGNPTSGTQITLRGVSTLSSGTQPLVLIDGVPGDLNSISPEDVESINVLKSGAAAAIYGTRGSNGVVLIETRNAIEKGKVEPTVRIKSAVTTEQLKREPDVLNAKEYKALGDEGIPGIVDYGANTDMVDEITRTPVSFRNNISITGGNSQTNYVLNVQDRRIEGIILESINNETKFRLNAVHKMFDNTLEIDANLIGYRQRYADNFDNNIWRSALAWFPTAPVKDENGNWMEFPSNHKQENPVALIRETEGINKNNRIKAYGNLYFRPINSLEFQLRGSMNSYNHTGGYYETQQYIEAVRGFHSGEANRDATTSEEQLLEFTGTWDKSFNNHNITALAGYSWQNNIYESFNAWNQNFPVDVYSYNNIGAGTKLQEGQADMNSYKSEIKLVGYFFRLNYDFNKKYFLMASIRHEGSSKFGSGNKWGTFPAVSGGWRINEEPFMEPLDFLSSLKLRAGYGITGTEPNSPYMSLTRLSFGSNVYLNGQWLSAIEPASNPNPNLKWEEKKEYNIGLDFGLYNERISGSIDLYKRQTEDLIWDYNVATPPFLYSRILANAGVIENLGYEINLSTVPIQTSDFTWNSSFNFSENSNKIVSLSGDRFKVEGGYFNTGWTGAPIQQPTHRVEEGGPVGNFYGYKSIDVSEDGTWIIEGANGDPKPVGEKTTEDKQILGNGLPDYNLSWNNTFRYNNFSLKIKMRGAFDYQILNMNRMFYQVPVWILRGNVLDGAFDPVYGKQRLSVDQPRQYVSYFVEDGDYWKIDNVTLGYSLNPNVEWLESLRIYATGMNLLTITGYNGIDPEVNALGLTPGIDDKFKYPHTRSFTLGVELTF